MLRLISRPKAFSRRSSSMIVSYTISAPPFGEVVRVEPQVFDLILHLVRHREHVVSKDQLLEVVWQGRIVSESALSTRINAERQAIGDSGERQQLIQTRARRGFRFVADVVEESAGNDAEQR